MRRADFSLYVLDPIKHVCLAKPFKMLLSQCSVIQTQYYVTSYVQKQPFCIVTDAFPPPLKSCPRHRWVKTMYNVKKLQLSVKEYRFPEWYKNGPNILNNSLSRSKWTNRAESSLAVSGTTENQSLALFEQRWVKLSKMYLLIVLHILKFLE